VFQDLEQLRLNLGIDIANLIQEHGAAVSDLEQAWFRMSFGNNRMAVVLSRSWTIMS
jgi:hypothetical protein